MSGKKLKKQNFKGISQKKLRLELDFLEKQNTQILGELSVVDVAIPLDFSFKQTAFDAESLQNPNIVEKDFLSLQNDAIKLKDKFDEIDDPFFDLDDARESISRTKIMKRDNLKNIARRINSTNGKANKRRTY